MAHRACAAGKAACGAAGGARIRGHMCFAGRDVIAVAERTDRAGCGARFGASQAR